MSALPRWSLGLTALLYLGFGGVMLLTPEILRLVAIEAVDVEGQIELRAFYGGLEIGLGVFFLLSLPRPAWHRPALAVQALSLGGIACARLVALLITPSEHSLIWGALALETGGALLGLVALRTAR